MNKKIPPYRVNGIIPLEAIKELGLLPPEERLKKGPVVLIECPERIPCNICVSACPYGAISMNSIIDIPKVDWDKCIGCATCVALCPGLAIFVIDLSQEDKGYVTVPHEFLPVPKRGEEVTLLGRDGKNLGKGKVVRIFERNKTYVITVEVPRELVFEVKAIWVEKR